MATECQTNKIDSNATGLRIAEEVCLKLLPSLGAGDPSDPVWRVLEPNSYADFGGNVVTVARNPINPTRSRKKGTVTDVDASGGYNFDVTQNSLTWLMQGILFADARQKAATQPINGTQRAITAVTATEYQAAAGLNVFAPGMLVLASGFNTAANNGLKVVTAADADSVAVAGLAVEAGPPAAAKLEAVGFQFDAGDASVVMSGNLVRLTSATEDMTTLGLIPGEWIFVGGDVAGNTFASNAPGFARIGRITATYLELDKVGWVPQADVGAGKTIRIFYGIVVQNESDPDLIKRRSYQLERTLGKDADGTMSEYLVGAVPNEFTLNVQQADKVTADISFVACDAEQRTGLQGVKTGSRPALVEADGFNTSSDFSRIKMAVVDPASSNPVALFAFVTEMTLTINNNVSPNKAIGVMGAMDVSAGTLEVGGSQTAYFASVEAVQAVRNNADVTVDIVMVKKNAGLLFDMPLTTLGNGRLNIEQDQPITLPLDTAAAMSKFGTTLMFQEFPYLPNAADV